MKDERRWQASAQMVKGRAVYDLVRRTDPSQAGRVCVAVSVGIDRGIEEHECVGLRTDRLVLACLVERVEDSRAQGNVSSRRVTGR